MRILHYCATYAPAWSFGGPPRSVANLCEGLAEHGLQVAVMTTNAGLEEEPSLPVGREIERKGVRVTYFPSKRSVLGIVSPALEAAVEHRVGEFDLVHLCGVWQPTARAAAKAARRAGVPYIVSPRGMLGPYSWSRRAWKKHAYWWLRERSLLHGASGFHVTSPSEAGDLLRLGLGADAWVIPNSIDLEVWSSGGGSRSAWRHQRGIEESEVVLIYAGRLHHKKALDFLPQVLEGWSEHRWKLVLAGPDEDGSGRAVAERLPTGRVLLTGPLDTAALAEAYAGSDLFVFPSLHENFGNVAVEALSAGLPVVMSPEVGASELMGDLEGVRVVERDPERWRRALTELGRASKEVRGRISNLRLTIDERFGRVSVAKRMLLAYQIVAKGRGRESTRDSPYQRTNEG